MCLVALAWKCDPRWRLLLAGNRDESHLRPTTALSAWASDPRIMAGRDLQSGGTWAGLANGGRVGVITNVRDPLARQSGPSRGALVADYLASPATATQFTAERYTTAQTYPPFNLLVADAEHCRYLGNHPASQASLAAGIHGMSNGPLDAPWPKTRRLTSALQQWLVTGRDDPDPLWAALADETPPPDSELPRTGVSLEWERRLATAFIRGNDYGTRASTIIGVDHDGNGFIVERRFGPGGTQMGQTQLEIRAHG